MDIKTGLSFEHMLWKAKNYSKLSLIITEI